MLRWVAYQGQASFFSVFADLVNKVGNWISHSHDSDLHPKVNRQTGQLFGNPFFIHYCT